MANFWEIKRYGDESVFVTERVAAQVAQAKAGGKDSVIIQRSGKDMLIDCKAISAVEESNTKIPDDNIYLLADGKDGSAKPEAILNLQGEVVTNWYKKFVSAKQYHGYYAALPSYHVLASDANGATIAFRKIEYYNDVKDANSDIELCTPEEADRLWDKLERQNGH